MDRRRFLEISAGLTVAAALAGRDAARAQAPGRVRRYADMHSHIGFGYSRTSVFTGSIQAAMARNGVVFVSRKIVADLPVISMAGNRIRAFRTARPGELWRAFESALDQAQATHRQQGLAEIASVESLDQAFQSATPAIVVAAEGADFLEGDIKRLEPMRGRGLVHLQLVHYRVSEVGDVATEAYVHNGLTPFGRELVAECNRQRILIDVAHGSPALIDQVLESTARPIVYSHAHLTNEAPEPSKPRAFYVPQAKKMAQQGGVMGVWPISFRYRSLDAWVDDLLRTAEILGVDHVGIGTDMEGLPGSVIPSYDTFPEVAERLTRRGVKDGEIEKLMGGNFHRVLRQALSVDRI
jgi:membrane dipeptidase